MGHKKGEISIITGSNGKSRLRWRHEGQRYSLNVDSKDSKVISAKIRLDIEQGSFDGNTEKYKTCRREVHILKGITIPNLYKKWLKEVKHGNLGNNSNYSQVMAMIEKWEDYRDVVKNLANENINYNTYNRRLSTLNQFYDWLCAHSYLKTNPFSGIGKKRNDGYILKTNRNPLTPDQINRFLQEVKYHKYGSFYYDFFYFIFATGVRNEEAVGFRAKYFHGNTINIHEVMARGKQGTNAKYRIRKMTKNLKKRTIPINITLSEILAKICRNKKPDDLVFLSPKGLCIDDRMLQKRIFKPIISNLGFGNRDLYVARHSFAARAINQGIPLTEIAALMGNTVETLTRNYANIINKPSTIVEL